MKTQITLNKNLTKSQKDTINKARVKEFGKENKKDFKKDYEPNTVWFFIKEKNKVVALGSLRPIKINYLKKTYDILGMGSIISIVKKKGYGRILIQEMIGYLDKKGKTALGFCSRNNTPFYEKAGLKSKKSFTWRFALKNPKTKEVKWDDGDCDGIYYEGRDKFISKVLRQNQLFIIILKILNIRIGNHRVTISKLSLFCNL